MSDRLADRRRRRAALGSAAFMVAGPGTVTGLVPWLLTRWKVRRPVPGGVPARALGAGLVAAGGAVVTHSFARFVMDGLGTPLPVAPPEHLVVSGIYRHVRNPMYVSLEAVIVGQALLLGQRRLLGYAAIVAIPPALFVRFYEEPKLAASFGEEYERYRRNVPRWLPRLRPWRPPGTEPR
ncbi:MAG TPA: isoprenylcysteine carboxylmethyltransferase family protein [Streptosporangiaceae bacterium]|nr:isoprenylcysteine carboxylmethyltransferase family protein [Streptosporangiaceae bacterium]